MKRLCQVVFTAVASVALMTCASNGRPFYQTGPGWEYYYEHFRPELDHIGANNSPASGEAYDTDPEFFFWNRVRADKLVIGMKDEEVLREVALRPDKTYRSRDGRKRAVELWVYRRDCSGFLRADDGIPADNVLILLHFIDGRLVGWEPNSVPVISPEDLPLGSRPSPTSVVGTG